jgi:hypothetical protein
MSQAALQADEGEFLLLRSAGAARPLKFDSQRTIRAEVLRALLLGLPIDGVVHSLTAIGVRLQGARIEGRLELNNARSPSGGPLAPLELSDCVFNGGFSGAHGRFSRLCFSGSRFSGAPTDDDGTPVPTIDLTNAVIASSLTMRGIKPVGDEDPLWVGATGARIDGKIDLSNSHLRGRAAAHGPPPEALSLTLAEIKGDLELMESARVEGRIGGRRAVIRGDVWMSGASIEVTAAASAPGKDVDALFFQSAEIGGLLMLNGDEKKSFQADGRINLTDLQLGGSLSLTNARLGPPRAPRVEPAERAGGTAGSDDEDEPATDGQDTAGFTCLSLEEACVGDSVDILIAAGERSRLAGALRFGNARISGSLTIRDAYVGQAIDEEPQIATIHAPYLSAQHLFISNVEPLLWEGAPADVTTDMMALSADFEGARIESLEIRDSWFNRSLKAPRLRVSGDVVLDVRIDGEVDLEACEFGGMLDISELRLDGASRGLKLREARVGRTLRVTKDRASAHEATLVAARRAPLHALRNCSLLEAVWRRDAGNGRFRFYQAGFVQNETRLFLLDGTSGSFDSVIGHFRENVIDERAAGGLMRLRCSYVRDRGGIRILLPEADENRNATSESEAGHERKRPPLRTLADGAGFELHTNALGEQGVVRQVVRLTTQNSGITFSVRERRLRQLSATPVPQVDQHFILTPPGQPPSADNPWVAPCPLDDASPVPQAELAGLAGRLKPLVETRAALHGTVDLEGLVCEMLDDNSGRCWGAPDRIEMNHFVYKRTVWQGQDRLEWKEPIRRGLSHARINVARRLPLKLVRWLGWTDHRLEALNRCAGWQARLNWIYRQYPASDPAWPASYKIRQSEYSPQPFEQAVKVCRAEGREDYAQHFEIEKQRIEWNLYNHRSRPWSALIGVLVALGWIAVTQLTRSPHKDQWLTPLILAAGIALASDVTNIAMRGMFGYLRRPIRAVTSLVVAFLIGWLAVHFANRNGLMAVAAEPVATVALRGDQPVRMGVQIGPAEPRIRCGEEISEPLYALDVLIPLIDLRQEMRCDIASVPSVVQPGAASGSSTQSVCRQPIPARPGPGQSLLARRPRPAFYCSERLWAWLKALYAIAGWFIVSLAILTFAQANRTKADDSA